MREARSRALRVGTLLLCAGGAPVLAGPPSPVAMVVVRQGDVVAGVGNIRTIDNLGVINSGEWLVEADTDFSDTNADSVVVTMEGLAVREGDSVPAPRRATISAFDSLSFNDNGRGAFNLFLDGLPGDMDSGVYYGDFELLIQEGDVSTAPEVSPGTIYTGWFDVKINDSSQILQVASVDDPAVASTTDRALIRIDYDEMSGTFTESLLAIEGEVRPGQTESIADFQTGPHASAFNNAAQALYIADLTGDASRDMAMYLDDTLVAQEGGLSPDGVRTYEFLTRAVALSNAGDVAFRANLSGDGATDEVLIFNGAIVASEGDVFPALSATPITGFGSAGAPIAVSDSGDLIWIATYGADSAIMKNDQPLLKSGDMVSGEFVSAISTVQDAFSASDDGRFVLVEVRLGALQDQAAVLIDTDPGADACPCDWNSDGFLNDSDFFDWVNDFFSRSGPRGGYDFNGDSFENEQDWFDFTNCFFGPPIDCVLVR